jgi:hypothetical protein
MQSTDDIPDQGDAVLSELLKNYPLEAPSPGFYDRALTVAAATSAGRQRWRWLAAGFGSAVAAGLLAWLAGGVLLDTPGTTNPEIPGVIIALEAAHEVNFVFSSARPLAGATLTIELPDGLEVRGFPGEPSVSWETSLTAGKNHLPLTLIATKPVTGIVLARLEHADRSKTFQLRVDAG